MVGRKTQDVEVGLAGGAHYGGVVSAGMTVVKGANAPELPKDVDQSWFTARPWPLTDFMESAGAIVQGTVIKRREIIKYFANTEGGVHLDRSSRVRRKEEELVSRIRRLEGKIKAFGTDGLYFELLSIGQAVGKAPDVIQLVEKIRARLKQKMSARRIASVAGTEARSWS